MTKQIVKGEAAVEKARKKLEQKKVELVFFYSSNGKLRRKVQELVK